MVVHAFEHVPSACLVNPVLQVSHFPAPTISHEEQLPPQGTHLFVVVSTVNPGSHFPVSQFVGWFTSHFVQLDPQGSHFLDVVENPYRISQNPALHVGGAVWQKVQKASHGVQAPLLREKPVAQL
jgi:hypothetical protein